MTRSLVFLASGAGGNLKFVDQCIRRGALPGWRLAGVIVDRPCGSADYARKVDLPLTEITYRREAPEALLAALAALAPDIAVTNFHKILDGETVSRHAGRLLNLHYSLLPAFGGLIGDKPVRAALEAGCKMLGTTTHWVTERVDAGPIISQSVLPVIDGEPFARTMSRVFRSGCANLLQALGLIDGSLTPQADLPDLLLPAGRPPRPIDPALWDLIPTL